MKKVLSLLLMCFASTTINAQDTRLVGTWIWHFDSPYEDEVEGPHSRDEYIRIDVDGENYYVRTKLASKDYKGNPFQTRREGENVRVNADGSISFDEYLSKDEYDEDDHLYWTVWTHYTVKYEGGRLLSSEKLMGEGRNAQGHLVKDETRRPFIEHKIYYNEKDNW